MGWEGVGRPFVRGTNPHKGPIDDKTSISSPARWPFVHGLQRGGRLGFKGDARAARLASDSGRFKGRFKRSCGWPVSLLVSSSTKWTMSLCRIGGDRCRDTNFTHRDESVDFYHERRLLQQSWILYDNNFKSGLLIVDRNYRKRLFLKIIYSIVCNFIVFAFDRSLEIRMTEL